MSKIQSLFNILSHVGGLRMAYKSQLMTIGNTVLTLIYSLYSSLLHTHNRILSSLVLSRQQIYKTVSLSLQITHGVFFLQPNSFFTFILQLPIPETWLNLIARSYPGRLASQSSTLHFRLGYLTTSLYSVKSKSESKSCYDRRLVGQFVLE
jgi:hypothetical protein